MDPEPQDETALEVRIRAEMPLLPPELRARVLERARHAAQSPQVRCGWRRRWAVAAVAGAVLQWAAVAVLDAQRAALLRPLGSAATLAQRPAAPATRLVSSGAGETRAFPFGAGHRRAELP